jgi:hypothetical protein
VPYLPDYFQHRTFVLCDQGSADLLANDVNSAREEGGRRKEEGGERRGREERGQGRDLEYEAS